MGGTARCTLSFHRPHRGNQGDVTLRHRLCIHADGEARSKMTTVDALSKHQPLTAVLVALALVAAPATHVVGAQATDRRLRKLFLPFRGKEAGERFLVFQTASWICWIAAAVACILTFYTGGPVVLKYGHYSVCMSGLLAEVLMVSSLMAFEPTTDRASENGNTGAFFKSKRAGFFATTTMSLFLAIAGFVVAYLGEINLEDNAEERRLFYILSGASLLTASTVTHGLGGRLLFNINWKFFQPLQGGARFVLLQAIGWALVSISLACYITQYVTDLPCACHSIIAIYRPSLPQLCAIGGSLAGVFAQLLLSASILVFRNKATEVARKNTKDFTDEGEVVENEAELEVSREILAKRISKWLEGQRAIVRTAFVLLALYGHPHLEVVFLTILFLTIPFKVFISALATWALIYYLIPLLKPGDPATDGSQYWDAFITSVAENMETALPIWLGKELRILADHPEKITTDGKYIFGYHPHGLYPATAGWFHHTKAFKRLLPDIRIVPLSASTLFYVPVLREITTWAGVRAVTRKAFISGLEDSGAVLVVPGGQAELVYAGPDTRRVGLCTRHKGFVRLALEQGASLVPMFVFGELQAQRNLLYLPALQRWTYKRLGFPLPFWVAGWKTITPLPTPGTPLSIVIGEPIDVEPTTPGRRPTDEEVDALHTTYFSALQNLVEKHKVEAGYPDLELEFRDD